MAAKTPATVAVAHYPEGAGHATRMLAIANALQASGVDVRMAGGGAGSKFVALNGYDAFEPTTVDYIDTYQDGSLRDVLTGSVPASAGRISDYRAWLRAVDPDALVTDDMFAAMAAIRMDVPLYVLKHDLPDLYDDRLERAGAAFHTRFQRSTAREFFYPALWPPTPDEPADITRVPPVALESDGGPENQVDVGPDDRVADAPDGQVDDAPDVLFVPSHYSTFDDLAETLDRRGYDVCNVGDDDWEAVPSLLPFVRTADVVVCSGYSTVMDAAVAGTPCVVVPATDEQEAVADRLDAAGTSGFVVAEDREAVLDAVAAPPAAPEYENGAERIAASVVDDLRVDAERDGAAETRADGVRSAGRASVAGGATSSVPGRVVGRAKRAVGATAVAPLLAWLVGQQVASHDAYFAIERSLPTYAGTIQTPFLLAALALVAIAAVASRLEAGFLPSVLLASAPVVGWAATHWTAPVAPHYAPTFPLEMALLYGGVLGTVGFLLGAGLPGSVESSRSLDR